MSQNKTPLKELRVSLASILRGAGLGATLSSDPRDSLILIDLPRPPGFSSTICFDKASEMLKPELETLEEEIGRKKAKKVLKGKVGELAADTARQAADAIREESVSLPLVSRVEAESGYINFYLDERACVEAILENIYERGTDYGRGEAKAGKVMVEFSQPNTHKPFHVGHTRNAVLGASVGNILEFAGFPVVKVNYIGDVGAHVIRSLWAIINFPDEFADVEGTGRRLGEYYTLAMRAESGEEIDLKAGKFSIDADRFESEIKELFRRWEARDEELLALWETTRRESIDDFERIYRILGIRFDHVFYESEMEEGGKSCVKELLEMGIAAKGESGDYEGAVFVDFDEISPGNGLGKIVLLRKDGTSLYQTKELGLARQKFQEYDIERSIYVVATEQSLYFRQVFTILKAWGFEQADKCVHLPYEIVMLPEGKMSSRSGMVVLFDDLLQETKSRVEAKTREKGYAGDVASAAEIIALGAIKYSMLDVDHNKVVVFDWDQALNFSGRAGPYLQYMVVRARRILAEARAVELAWKTPEDGLSEHEVGLGLLLGRFPEVLDEARDDLAPYHIARYAYEVCKRFGEFYRFCPVLKSKAGTREFRLSLVSAFVNVLELSLGLLGIDVPEAM